MTDPRIPSEVIEALTAYGRACARGKATTETLYALVQAIADAIAQAQTARDDISQRFGKLSNAALLASNILYNLAGGAVFDERAKKSCKEVQLMLDEARRP